VGGIPYPGDMHLLWWMDGELPGTGQRSDWLSARARERERERGKM